MFSEICLREIATNVFKKQYLIMKFLLLPALFLILFVHVFSQNKGLEKLVETENLFAKTAGLNGQNAAFLEFLANDGIIFRPDAKNGKEFFRNSPEISDFLSWQTVFADISANNAIGYTTGDWQFSTKKGENPSAFGQFVSIWQKQQNGEFKVVLDIRISHEKPKSVEAKWTFPASSNESPTKFSAFLTAESVYDRSQFVSMFENIYKKHFADDVRVLREGKLPIIGKKNALSVLKKEVSLKHFPKLKLGFGIQDLAYTFGTYDSPNDKGNFVEIWKFRKGKWQIVLNIVSPIKS